MEIYSFQIGKKGALVARRPDGSTLKTGLRLQGDQLLVFDRKTGQWVVIPNRIAQRSNPDISISIIERAHGTTSKSTECST
jgi:hypothetical protein